MGGQNSWRQSITGEDYLRSSEKRILNQERRPQARTAADLLGPGIAPFAVEIFDWDGDATAFNGFWFSAPGALHTPDPTNSKWYMGQSEATADGFGLQWATEFRDIAGSLWPPRQFIRRFFDPGSAGTRTFSAWADNSDTHYLGEVIMYASETPPTEKWLFCNGAAISRTIYAEFFTKFQTMPWGIGNGTTTFNIPDWRRRFPRGSATGQGYAVGVDEGHPAVDDRNVRHIHAIDQQGEFPNDSWAVPNTGPALSPRIVDYRNHDHGGETGQSSSADFPYSNIPIHIKVLS